MYRVSRVARDTQLAIYQPSIIYLPSYLSTQLTYLSIQLSLSIHLGSVAQSYRRRLAAQRGTRKGLQLVVRGATWLG